MKPFRFFSTLLILISCSNPDYRMLKKERLLGTDGEKKWIFHRIIDDPYSFGLRFPGYIIGIEKTDRDILNIENSAFFKRIQDNTDLDATQADFYKQRLNDPKLSFISHIAQYSKTADDRFMPVSINLIYSSYSDKGKTKSIYDDSYNSLTLLRKNIEENLKQRKYTHIILISMGWNTDQQESISNFNSLISYLDETKEKNWHPLVIGLTWPSTWLNVEALSYMNKANDADEIGMIWANALLREVLVPIKHKEKIPLILIGHSFGARLITRSVFSHTLLSREIKVQKDDINLVLGLQGAFTIHRFLDDSNNKLLCEGKGQTGREGNPYAKYQNYSIKFAFTWAEEDSATPLARWVTGAKHIGGKPATQLAAKCPRLFQMVKAFETGAISYAEESESVLYIDASDIVHEEQYRKGGRAHSDIYKPEVAKLIWNVIDRYTRQE